jgi:hypothetical protein
VPDNSPSPWARRGSDDARDDIVLAPASARPGGAPLPVRDSGTFGAAARAPAAGPDASQPIAMTGAPAAGRFGAGTVTVSAADPIALSAPLIDLDAPPDAAAQRRRTMKWFAGGAGGILVVGVVVLLAMILTGNSPLRLGGAAPPPDTRSLLAKMCPPPSGPAAEPGPVPATPPGPRIVDRQSGISYMAYGAPWQTWRDLFQPDGDLQVDYRMGQYFVTEEYVGGEYLATILSASVPAATNDAMTLDLKCAGAQVAADARQAYYPQPNTMEPIRNEQATLGGRPAWVSEFRLHFHEQGLRATDELVMIATIDVGRPQAAIFYISIPGTHSQYDYVVDEELASIRPTG